MGKSRISVLDDKTADWGSYLVIPGFYDEAETMEMLDRAHELLNGFDIKDHPMASRMTQAEIKGH